MKSQIDYGYYQRWYETNEEHYDTSTLLARLISKFLQNIKIIIK